jgi:hypothetical protein
MLALAGDSPTEFIATQNYLESIQTEEGCWNNNNLRDTGFILYSGFGTSVPSAKSSGGGSSFGECLAPRSCEFATDCMNAGAEVLFDLSCPGISVCCSESVEKLSCSEQSGSLCSIGESCSGTEVSSSSGTCCLGSCVKNTRQDTCESFGIGTCRISCGSGEEERGSAVCEDSFEACCVESFDDDSGSGFTFWIITLILLILVVGLLIVFRKKLQLWWHRRKGRKSNAGGRPGPGGPGGLMYNGLVNRGAPAGAGRPGPGAMPQGRPPMRRQAQSGALDATMQKLRNMGK